MFLEKLDYKKKKSLTFSHSIDASLADNEIMEFAKDFYKDVTPFNPSKFGPGEVKKERLKVNFDLSAPKLVRKLLYSKGRRI